MWLRLGTVIDTIELYILIPVYLALTLIQGHRSARKQKIMQQLSHIIYFNRFRWNLVYCWNLLVRWTPYSLYVIYLVLKGGNPFCVISFFFSSFFYFNNGLCSDIYRPISFKFSIMIETTKLYILISVWMTLTFKVTIAWEIKKLWCPSSWKLCDRFGWNSVCGHNLLVC